MWTITATPPRIDPRLKAHLRPLLPGLAVAALMLVWAVHDGGYDSDTWYWGALALLGVIGAILVNAPPRLAALPRATRVALGAFALYVAWSYLSIAWASSPGDALQGANRTLLYLLAFAVLAILPWTAEAAAAVLTAFVAGIGGIAFVLLYRLASADHVQALVIEGRLAAPTGYFNATAALFTTNALTAMVLASRRRLPAPARGGLLAVACAGLELSLIVQSRGWLFTLPLIALAVLVMAPDRLRFVAAASLPVTAAIVPLHRLLAVYGASAGASLNAAAHHAGQAALLSCAMVLVAGTVAGWVEALRGRTALSGLTRRAVGASLAVFAACAICVGSLAATHGHPLRFISREWNGFSRPEAAYSATSHFTDVGSGRYDFWRVSLDAFLAHPVGGLGQDNFADYYVRHRRTGEEPSWTHSIEMRLLAHTGAVGFGLFAVFLAAAVMAALRGRRTASELASVTAAAATVPLLVWLIHGSVDWFWEIPALTGPALGFVAIAGALGRGHTIVPSPAAGRPASLLPRVAIASVASAAVIAGVVVLGLPYLSVREVSAAANVRAGDPAAALRALARAAQLNPLSADPGRIAGSIALGTGQYGTAQVRFRQAIARDPGGWYAWLGDGLAASALGERARARRDFEVAASINSVQPAVRQALARVDSRDPLTPAQAQTLLVLAT